MNEKMKMQSEWIKQLRKENEDLNNRVKKLIWENKRLQRDLEDLQRFCMNFAADHEELDFPNSNTEANEPKSSGDKIY